MSQVVHQGRAYPSFLIVKQIGVLQSALCSAGWDASPLFEGLPPGSKFANWYPFIHYCWVVRKQINTTPGLKVDRGSISIV